VTYTDEDVVAVEKALSAYRAGSYDEIGIALAIVGLSSERAANEVRIRDSLIRVAHRAGASLRQIADASGLNRKTVTAIAQEHRGLENDRAESRGKGSGR
jgi:hypothetical protein